MDASSTPWKYQKTVRLIGSCFFGSLNYDAQSLLELFSEILAKSFLNSSTGSIRNMLTHVCVGVSLPSHCKLNLSQSCYSYYRRCTIEKRFYYKLNK